MRPVRHESEHRQTAGGRHRRDRQDHALPGQIAAQAADEMGQCRSEHQRPDQPAECEPEVAVEPARRDLHADGIHAREKEAGRDPRREQRHELAAARQRRGIGRRAGERGQDVDDAWRVAVGDRQPGEHQRARDEAELHGDRDVAHRGRRQAGAALQVGHHRIAGEPQRCRGELREDDRRQDAGGNGGQGEFRV